MKKQPTPIKITLAETLGQQHWYKVGDKYYPSSTTILQAYPFSQHLVKWVAEKGYDEAQTIKQEAGIKGTNVHRGIDLLLQGEDLYKEHYSLEEWHKLNLFAAWYKEFQPDIIRTEQAVFSKKYGYAGRTDVILRVNEKLIICDWKTSGSIYDHFALQVASYAHAYEEMKLGKVSETAILQLGAKNKNGYRFVIYPEWKDHFKIFLNVFETWKYDNGVDGDFEPPILVLPETLKL